MVRVGPARPFVVGGAEAWAIFVCRAVLPAHVRLLRSGCGRGVLWRWSVGTSPTFLCWAQRPFLKNLFWQLLSVFLIKRQPKKHLRDAAVGVQALETVSQPSAPQPARETAVAQRRASTSGQLGKSQFGLKKPPHRRASALFRRHAATQPRSAPRNLKAARRRPENSNIVRRFVRPAW